MTVTKFDLHQTITDQIIEASCLCRSSRRQESKRPAWLH